MSRAHGSLRVSCIPLQIGSGSWQLLYRRTMRAHLYQAFEASEQYQERAKTKATIELWNGPASGLVQLSPYRRTREQQTKGDQDDRNSRLTENAEEISHVSLFAV